MHRLVAEHPVGAGRETVKQSFGAQEIDVRERGEEEQAFDAGGEADEIEQELLSLSQVFRAAATWLIESIHLKQKSAFMRIDGMFSIAANASARSSRSGM